MIKAAIFDLDGLLIDSEPFWQDAEVEVFATVGLNITREDCKQTMGFRIDEAVGYWHHKHPWNGPSVQEVAVAVVNRMLQLVREHGKPMPGTLATIEFFQNKNIPLAVASSSNMALIETALEALGITHFFDHICSAQFEEFGKPHPAIFINTAKKLGVQPIDCLVFEDSFYGLVAAKAAKMKAIAVPEPEFFDDPRFGLADIKLRSLEEWDEILFNTISG